MDSYWFFISNSYLYKHKEKHQCHYKVTTDENTIANTEACNLLRQLVRLTLRLQLLDAAFFALELTPTSAPADSILGLLSPLPCSSSLLPLFRATVLVAVLHVSSIAMAFRIFYARVASSFPYFSKFRKHALQMQPEVSGCPSPINVILSTSFPHRCNSNPNTFSHSSKILWDASLANILQSPIEVLQPQPRQ